MIEVLAVPRKDHYEHKYSLDCMVDVDGLGDCVEWIISSRYNLKECVCVSVSDIHHMYFVHVCVPLCFSLEIRKYKNNQGFQFIGLSPFFFV